MDTARLAAIRAREQAASPGPWVWARDYCMRDGRHWCLENPGNRKQTVNWRTVLLETHETDFDGIPLNQTPDLVFIAAARSDVPDLLTEIDRLRTIAAALYDEARYARDVLYQHGFRWAGDVTPYPDNPYREPAAK